jgi:ATP-dependent helicase/nuclease subunit B
MYHECIMKVSEKVLKGDIPLPADEKVIGEAVEKELERMSSEYRGGLFSSNGREEYRFSRIKDICVEAMMAVAEQIEQGKITGAAFEEGFGRGRRFEPIEFEVDGKKVYIEGRIDRIDILAGDRIRIIDYKTGADEFDMEQMRQGYKMQLMVYLQGATGGKYEPAGMFYFKIKDSMIALNGTGSAEKQQAALDKESEGRFKLEGAYISEGEIIDAMPESVLDKKSKALEREEFVTLEKDVRKAIENISAGIIRGEIPIQPAKPRQDEYCKECKYCEYGAICKFDLSFGGNRYRNV